jgi:hypothetical protein
LNENDQYYFGPLALLLSEPAQAWSGANVGCGE